MTALLAPNGQGKKTGNSAPNPLANHRIVPGWSTLGNQMVGVEIHFPAPILRAGVEFELYFGEGCRWADTPSDDPFLLALQEAPPSLDRCDWPWQWCARSVIARSTSVCSARLAMCACSIRPSHAGPGPACKRHRRVNGSKRPGAASLWA